MKPYETAKAKVASLQADLAGHEAKAKAFGEQGAALEAQRGQVLLDGGDMEGLRQEINVAAHMEAASVAAIAILQERIGAAQASQRAAVASELRARAMALQVDVDRREVALVKLAAEWERLDGPGSLMRHPLYSLAERDRAQAAQAMNAADVVARGQRCPQDSVTGLRFDAGLW